MALNIFHGLKVVVAMLSSVLLNERHLCTLNHFSWFEGCCDAQFFFIE